jgi:hypothetical protein
MSADRYLWMDIAGLVKIAPWRQIPARAAAAITLSYAEMTRSPPAWSRS